MKKHSISWHKKKCWKLFSLYIRLKETDANGYGNCITCGTNHHYKDLQAGHFVDGRGNSILFDQRGVHIQCYACNCCLHGSKLKYWVWMEKNFGRNTIDELIILSKQPRKFTISELEQMAIDYTLRTSEMLKGKQI